MRDPRDIILRPVITERSYAQADKNRYSFIVDRRARKTEIKKAIEDIFNVKVLDISTMIVKRKPLRRPGRRGQTLGYTSEQKKAVVRLRVGDKIEVFENR